MKEETAPNPAYRLVPSHFPPIGLFDTVSTAADLAAVMDLVGWTNDRLVAERLDRLPREEWVFGRPNASIVMASFLHVAPDGMRFNNGDLGAWYAAAALTTSIAEVAHHMRREAVATGQTHVARTFRTYSATLTGTFADIRGLAASRPELYDPVRYAEAQHFGETIRANGGAGLLYDSVRHLGGTSLVVYRPSNILDVTQTDHYEITVEARSSRIVAKKLTA